RWRASLEPAPTPARADRRLPARPPTQRAPRKSKKVADPATDYARAVVAGRVVAGHLVRQACQRHLDDLKHGGKRGLTWRPDLAARAYRFFAGLGLAD